MHNKNKHTKITLALLWTSIMFLMVFADVFSIIVEFEIGNTIEIPIEVKTAMAIAAIVISFPIFMIVLSWILPYKVNRLTNIGVAVFTIIFIVAGGSFFVHYYIMGGLEIILLVFVIRTSLKWQEQINGNNVST